MSHIGYGRAPMPPPYWGHTPHQRYNPIPYGAAPVPSHHAQLYPYGRSIPAHNGNQRVTNAERQRSLSGDYTLILHDNNGRRRSSGVHDAAPPGEVYISSTGPVVRSDGGPQWRGPVPYPPAGFTLDEPQSYPPRGHMPNSVATSYTLSDAHPKMDDSFEDARALAAEALLELSVWPRIGHAHLFGEQSPAWSEPPSRKSEDCASGECADFSMKSTSHLSRTVFPTPPMTPPGKKKASKRKPKAPTAPARSATPCRQESVDTASNAPSDILAA